MIAETSYNLPVVLETERTVMRPHRLDDFDDLASMWAEPAVVRHISGKPSTKRESWLRLLRYIGHWPALGYGNWVVTDKETGAFLGEVGFADNMREIDPSFDRVPETGWVFKPDAHGRGLATETVSAALRWGDAHLPNDRTFCIVDPEYAASIGVAIKNGYRECSREPYMGQPALFLDRRRPAV